MNNLKAKSFAALGLLSFLVMLTYALVKPPIESLFLEYQSSKRLPFAWLLMVAAAFLAMEILNQFNAKHSLLKVFSGASFVSGILLLPMMGLFAIVPNAAVYLMVIWKEVYIVVLVEVFWSFANVSYPIRTARWAYGILLALGSLGCVVGNLVVGPISGMIGTVNTLYTSLPVFAICIAIPFLCSKFLRDDQVCAAEKKRPQEWGRAIKIVTQSKYLMPVLIFVMVAQFAVTLVEFELNTMLEATFTDLDARTAVIGRVMAIINVLATGMQLVAGPIFRLVGVAGTLVGVPLILTATVVSFIISPQFITIIIARVAGKTFDYSLLKAAKEILYIPLSRLEKTQGKALIDIFAYRIARGMCSVLLLVLAAFEAGNVAMYFSFALMVIWLVVAIVIAKRFRSVVSHDEEFAFHASKKKDSELVATT